MRTNLHCLSCGESLNTIAIRKLYECSKCGFKISGQAVLAIFESIETIENNKKVLNED